MSSCKIIFFLSIIASVAMSISPPVGLKPAIDIDSPNSQTTTFTAIPPNLRIRSRMMAALNGEESSKSPLILTKKNKKKDVKKEPKVFFGDSLKVNENTTPRAPQKVVPPSANFAVNPVLQTNFVDSTGRVLQNVIAVPIRVGDGTRRNTATRTASAAAVVEPDVEDKKVEVRFGQAPIRL